MNVLIACEESQRVCAEFRRLGHRAFSCDIQECSGGHPEWHVNGDVLPLLDGKCSFTTQDGEMHSIDSKWDLIIAHPPCTYLTVSGNGWFNVDKYGEKAIEREREREQAVEFFMKFVNADCDHIAIENPIGTINTRYRRPDCIIHPYYFGDRVRKATCLWLKGLPNLVATDLVDYDYYTTVTKTGRITTHSGNAYYATDEDGRILRWNDPRTAIERSKTYPGVARAMAEQWSRYLESDDKYDVVDDYEQFRLF